MEAGDHNVFDEGLAGPLARAPYRVLIAAPNECAARLQSVIRAAGHTGRAATSVAELRRTLSCCTLDVVVIDPALEGGAPDMSLLRLPATIDPMIRVIVIAADDSFELAAASLRAGVAELIRRDSGAAEILDAVGKAAAQSREARDLRERIERLREMVRTLGEARQQSHHQVELLCRDLAEAYEEVAQQVNDATIASEFRTLLGQELDLESLLRTMLEYMLTKTGPTNAAVFLPDQYQKYSLGAYVNYDCPREAADVLLAHLAESVCPHLEDEAEIIRFEDADEFAAAIGPEAAFLHGSQMIALRCHDGHETLAVMVLFRRGDQPFDENLPHVLDNLRTIFARQVASVIRVHHRADPQWPREPEDSFDLDDDCGLGGLAA